MGITASAPSNGVDDENLAIAYISMFILIFLVCFISLTRIIRWADDSKVMLFPLGGFLLISKDFEGPHTCEYNSNSHAGAVIGTAISHTTVVA